MNKEDMKNIFDHLRMCSAYTLQYACSNFDSTDERNAAHALWETVSAAKMAMAEHFGFDTSTPPFAK